MERYFGQADIAHFTNDAQEVRLAHAFSEHLASYRSTQPIPAHVGEITSHPPSLESEMVRLPHLVAFVENEEIRDIVMWEKLSKQEAVRWLGSELPDQEFIERHLADLLDLKRRAREGSLDPVLHKEIRDKLVGRYISILFVYQHFHLFKDLWDNSID